LSELVQLRYTGELPVTFQHPGIGYVEPQGEFSVAEEDAERFTRRGDVEHADGTSGASSARQDVDTSGGGPSGRRGRSKGTKNDGEAGVP
jgi:hypothetical protein